MNTDRRLVIRLLGSLLLATTAIGTAATAAPRAHAAVLAQDPPLTVPQATLDSALHCTPFGHPDKPAVLLVHGTGATGADEYTFFFTPQLVALGYDVCIVTYPDRGLVDQQISAEYIVSALRRMHAQTGRRVAMIGHSQGATMPRWALKFWPSAREAVDDFVMLAGPNHGTTVAIPFALAGGLVNLPILRRLPLGLLPESIYQFLPDSDFVTTLNQGDETPGSIAYTSIYTRFDQLVQPVAPIATAALEPSASNPDRSNILLQDVCRGHLAEHLSIGTTDTLAFALALDAIGNPGPADVARAGGSAALCRLLPVDLRASLQAPVVRNLLAIVAQDLQTGLPQLHLASEEPPLMPYARASSAP